MKNGFRRFRKNEKIDLGPSVRLVARNNSAPTGCIFMKFYISEFFEKLSIKFKFH